ncbi:MAG: hypothetical protein KJ574_00915 [Nanoarchaeota archaeon]|nr:hypothetical protein [Nanoarchaeota archaeon]
MKSDNRPIDKPAESTEKSRLESFVYKSVPWLIIALVILLLFELFIKLDDTQLLCLELINFVIILMFAIDLYYLYKKSPDWKHFVKHYWPDIIAIIPLTLIFRIMHAANLGQDMEYATVINLFKVVRIERFFEAQRLKKVGEVTKTFKEINAMRSVRLVGVYDKARRGTAKTFTRAKLKKKDKD